MPTTEKGQMDIPSEDLGEPTFHKLGHINKASIWNDDPDEFTQAGIQDLDHAAKEQNLEHNQDEHTQRIEFAKKIYLLSCIWLVLVIGVVIASGVTCLPFKLDNSVLITLLTTTTATVLGLFISVLNYLFSRRK